MHTDRPVVGRRRQGAFAATWRRARIVGRAAKVRMRDGVAGFATTVGEILAAGALLTDVSAWAFCELAATGGMAASRTGRLSGSARRWLRNQLPWLTTAALGTIGLYLLFWTVPQGERVSATSIAAADASANAVAPPTAADGSASGARQADTIAGAPAAVERTAPDAGVGPSPGDVQSEPRAAGRPETRSNLSEPFRETPSFESPGVAEPAPLPETPHPIRPVEATERGTKAVVRGVEDADAEPPDEAPVPVERPAAILDAEVEVRVDQAAEPTVGVVGRLSPDRTWRAGTLPVDANSNWVDEGGWTASTTDVVRPRVSGSPVAIAAVPPRVLTVSRPVRKQFSSQPLSTTVRRQQVRVIVERSGDEPVRVGDLRRFVIRVRNPGPAIVVNARIEVDLPPHLRHRHGRALQKRLAPLRPGAERRVPVTVLAVAEGSGDIAVRLMGRMDPFDADTADAAGDEAARDGRPRWHASAAPGPATFADAESPTFLLPIAPTNEAARTGRNDRAVRGSEIESGEASPLAQGSLRVDVFRRKEAAAAEVAGPSAVPTRPIPVDWMPDRWTAPCLCGR